MAEREKVDDDGNARDILGYVMTRGGGSSWMYCGTTPKEVANCVSAELDCNEGLSAEEIDTMEIKPRLFSQHELDTMPEFDGW